MAHRVDVHLGMFMAISIPISFLESSITVLLLAIAWPFFLGLGLGPGGMLR